MKYMKQQLMKIKSGGKSMFELILAKNWFKNSVSLVILLSIVFIFDFPQAVFSQEQSQNQAVNSELSGPVLPKVSERQAKTTMHITVTSYNSEPGQTDSTPFITAFGTTVRDGIVATNFLPKGTLVRFPEQFGDKVFVVEDRMNSRYYYRMDIWMAEKQEAIQFGTKYLKMEIL